MLVRVLVCMLVGLAVVPVRANATLLGLTISARLGTHHHFSRGAPFESPVVISAGKEITAGFVAPFTETPWRVTVTFEADDFTVGLSSPGAADWVGSGPYLPIATVMLSGFPSSVPGFVLSSYSCGPYVDICGDPVPGPSVFGPSLTGGRFVASFGPVRDGEVYTFSVAAVPEPGALGLVVVGFVGVWVMRWCSKDGAKSCTHAIIRA